MKLFKTTMAALIMTTGLASSAIAETKAFLQITLQIVDDNRSEAAGIYSKYKEPFLSKIDGAMSKQLLVRSEDVQVLHGFGSTEQAAAYLQSELFANDVVGELGSLLAAEPEIRIYEAH